VGGGYAGIAAGEYSGVLVGSVNDACTDNSAIAAGLNNGIFVDSANPQGGASGSFIGAGNGNTSSGFYTALGAGQENTITTLGAWSFLGAGDYNSVNAPYAFVGAGIDNETDGQNSFVGGGQGNVATGAYAAIAGGGAGGDYELGQHEGNKASGDYSFIGGGESSIAGGTGSAVLGGFAGFATGNYASVGGGEANFATATFSFVGAGYSNRVSGASAFIGSGSGNTASGLDASIGAGTANVAAASAGVIGGGNDNLVSPGTAGRSNGAAYGVVGGGAHNAVKSLIDGGAEYGVVAGGSGNTVEGVAGAVGGGDGNTVSGIYATVPGGAENLAAGTGSFAAGVRARATNNGAFVWSDGTGTKSLASTANDQFLARASGGIFLYSNATDTAGVKLAPGSGTWASLSDRTMKTAIAPLDERSILAKVVALPVTSWSYRSEDPRVRHVGPMAQDFYAAFRVGEDDRHITTIDEDGVALAAIKGLNAKTEREDTTRQMAIERLERQNAKLANELALLKREVAALAARR